MALYTKTKTMKTFVYPMVVLLCLGFTGCKKLVSFDMEYDNSVVIPANSIINLPIDIISPETTTNSEEEFGNNGTGSNLISRVALTNLDLKILNPESQNFNFLKSVELYLRAPDLPEVLVAYNYDVPATGLKEIALSCPDQDLKEYLKKPSYSLRVKAVTDEALAQDTEVNAHSRFVVDAGIF